MEIFGHKLIGNLRGLSNGLRQSTSTTCNHCLTCPGHSVVIGSVVRSIPNAAAATLASSSDERQIQLRGNVIRPFISPRLGAGTSVWIPRANVSDRWKADLPAITTSDMSVSCLETCPDCGIVLPAVQGSTHEYLGASPSCWALYGEVLAREYGDPGLMQIHRLTVDAYAAQHPGRPGRRSTQSVWVHLAGLYLTVEKGLGSDFARRVIGMLTREAEAFP